jgi:hypothetical protein
VSACSRNNSPITPTAPITSTNGSVLNGRFSDAELDDPTDPNHSGGEDPSNPPPPSGGGNNPPTSPTLRDSLSLPLPLQIENLLAQLRDESRSDPAHMRTLGFPGAQPNFYVETETETENGFVISGSPGQILRQAIQDNQHNAGDASFGAHCATARYYLNRMIAIALQMGLNENEIYSETFIHRMQMHSFSLAPNAI